MESNERDRLRVLLEYWVSHNREHIAENRKWRDRAAEGGLGDVARRLEKALELSEEVNRQMERALESIVSSGETDRERPQGRERPPGEGAHEHGPVNDAHPLGRGPERGHPAHAHRGSTGRLHTHGHSREHARAVPHRHIELHQIGTIRTPYRERVPEDFQELSGAPGRRGGDVPLQGGRPEGEDFRLELDERYKEGLLGLETLAYVHVLFHFDRCSGKGAPLVVAPRQGGGAHVGVFASRSPDRPNPLGLSVVRVLGIEGSTVRISPIDVLDGTPLLDVKPYFASDDSKPDAGEGWRKGAKR